MNIKEIEVKAQNNEEGYDLHEKLAKKEDEILLNTAENQSSKDTVLKETSMNDKGENYQDVEYEDNVVEFREFVIKRVQSASMRVPMRVEGQDINAVLDTGAEVTVLSTKVFEGISKGGRPELGKAEGTLKLADTGTELTTEGMAEVKINVGNQEIHWRVYVADISDDLLLGCDFVYEMNLTIHPKKGILINDEWIKMNTKRSHNISQLLVHETTTVPPMSEVILQGRSEDCENIDTRYAEFEPFPSEEDVIFAKSLVDPFRKTIPVRIVNLHRFPVKFRKDAILGDLIPVLKIEEIDIHTEDPIDYAVRILGQKQAGVTEIDLSETKEDIVIPDEWIRRCGMDESDGEQADISSLPEHLLDLYKRSSENIESEVHKKTLARVLVKHKDTFAQNQTDLGYCNVIEHKIDTSGAAPIRQPLRRTPHGFEHEEEKYLKDQLETGIIRPSKSAWASPVVLVRKKDGTVRWCIDFRKLNDRTIKDAYPLPRIDMCLDCLSSAKIFSTMDLQSGYWQITLNEDDQHKTAFITKYGLYEYTKMPFGLCNAPSTFQRCMELIFRGMQWETLLIYLDDIILYSSTITDHLEKLDEVLTKLQGSGLKLKPSKCEFIQSEVLYLGHVVSADGIKPNPKIVSTIGNWKSPTNVKEVQQFLGLCNYYRRFIHKFSERAASLTHLTKKGVTFDWTVHCEESFQFLKKALCQSPILAYPRPDHQFILDTDASNNGIGAVLSQVQDGTEKVIAYASKKLDQHQMRYNVTRRELLAVITFINQFKHYLLGRQFLLRTDHGSLRWLFNFKDPTGQLARWLEFLSQFNFEIVHREGIKHQNADALSRKDSTPLCAHQKEGAPDISCDTCEQLKDEWSDFHTEVDNVTNLAVTACPNIVRSITRSQANQGNANSNWIPTYSPLDLHNLQSEDADLKHLHQWKEDGCIPSRDEAAKLSPAVRKFWLNWPMIVEKNGVLYQRNIHEDNTETLQLLVPRCLRQEILQNCHNSVYGAHFGVHKTIEKIKERYYWYKMSEDTKDHIKSCETCNLWKFQSRKPRSDLSNYRVGFPLDRVALDIMGPFPISTKRNRYILVIGDHFTRWMEAYPMQTQHAEEVAKLLVHQFISRFGTPLEIHTDQGSNFDSSLFREVCKLLQITKTRTTPYRPCSNGIIERFNKTLGSMIKSFVRDNPDEWDKYIDLLMAAYRSTVHPSTGFTPNRMMLGREVHIPIHLIYPIPNDSRDLAPHEYIKELKHKLELMYDLARENLGSSAVRQKIQYDTRVARNEYKMGMMVFKLKPSFHKLEPAWSGPYVIVEVLSSVLYRIKNRRQTEVVHHDRLKPCYVEVPKWAKALGAQSM